MFFLTQEASSTKGEILLLSHLFCDELHGEDDEHKWDTEAFAEPLLSRRITEVLSEFLASEEKDGLLIDPNVWRSASESGGQVAYFCTSFAGVVVNILETISNLDADKFDRHKEALFPMICSLVRAQSDEIRQLVSDILKKQVGLLIGVPDTEQRAI